MPRSTPSPARQSMRRVATGVCAALIVSLTGCALQSPDLAKPGEAAVSVRQQLEAAIGRVQSQPAWSGGPDNRTPRPDFSGDAISVAWQGDAADLLNEIARQRYLRFSVTGPQPRLPIYVFVNATNETYMGLLRDIDKQLGQRASVALGDDYLELRFR